MTSRSTWKGLERKISKSLGTERTPLSGGNSKQTRSDTLSNDYFVEIKYRASFSTMVLYRKTCELARHENKTPVLCLKEKRQRGEVAVIGWDLFLKLIGKGKEI